MNLARSPFPCILDLGIYCNHCLLWRFAHWRLPRRWERVESAAGGACRSRDSLFPAAFAIVPGEVPAEKLGKVGGLALAAVSRLCGEVPAAAPGAPARGATRRVEPRHGSVSDRVCGRGATRIAVRNPIGGALGGTVAPGP